MIKITIPNKRMTITLEVTKGTIISKKIGKYGKDIYKIIPPMKSTHKAGKKISYYYKYKFGAKIRHKRKNRKK